MYKSVLGFYCWEINCHNSGLPGGSVGKESTCNAEDLGSINPWSGRIPWRKAWQPTPVFLPGESHGQRSLAGCSPWGHKELDMTELLNTAQQLKTIQICSLRVYVSQGSRHRRVKPLHMFSQGCNQGISQAMFSSEGLTREESNAKLTEVVCRNIFRVPAWLKPFFFFFFFG